MPSLPPIRPGSGSGRADTPNTPSSGGQMLSPGSTKQPVISELEAHNLIGKLHLMRRQVDEERDSFRTEIAALKQQNKQLIDSRAQFEKAVNSQLTNQLAAFQKVVADADLLRSSLASETAKSASLEKEVAELGSQVPKLRSEKEKMQRKYQQEIFDLQNIHQSQLNDRETRISSLDDEVSNLNKTLQQHERTATASIESSVKDLEDVKQFFAVELRSREKEIAELHEEVRMRDRILLEHKLDNERVVNGLSSEIAGLKENIHSLEVKLVAKDVAVAESPERKEYLELKELLPLREQTLLAVSTQLAELERQHGLTLERHEREVAELKDAMEKAVGALHTEMHHQADRFQKEVARKEVEKAELHKILDENISLLDDEREKHATEVDRHARELRALEEGRAVLVEENRVLQQLRDNSGKEVSREIRQYEVKFTQLQNQLDMANDKFKDITQFKDTKITELMEIARIAETDLTSLQQEYRDKEKQWETRVEQKEQGYDRLLGTVKQVERQVDIERKRTEDEQAKAAMQHKEALKRERALSSRIDDLNLEIAELVRGREVKAMEITELNASFIARVVAINEEFADERLAFAATKDQLERDLETERKRREEADEDLQETLSRLKKARDDYDTMQAAADLEKKKLEKAITTLQIEKKHLSDSLIEKTQEMTLQIQKLNQTIAKLEAEAEKMKYQLASLEEAEFTLAELRRKLEESLNSVENMKKQLRQKDFQVDDVKKETAELLFAKEVAYKKLLESFTAVQQEAEHDKQQHRQEITRLDEKFREKEREVKTMRNDYFAKLEMEQAQNTRMFEETRTEMETWKSAAIKYKDLSESTENTLKEEKENFMRLLKEFSDRNHGLESETVRLQTTLDNLGAKYDADLAGVTESFKSQVSDLTVRNRRLEDDLEKFGIFHRDEMQRLTDELNTGLLVQSLRQEITELRQISDTKSKSLHVVYTENGSLQKEVERKQAEKENFAKEMNLRLRTEELKYKRLIFENEELKQLLVEEVKKAEETCRLLEEQLIELPKPFEEQVAESQRRAFALADALAKMAKENADLESKLGQVTRRAEAHEAELAAQIKIAEQVFLELQHTEM